MKRSEINRAIATATEAFGRNGWHLPPNPRWDVTDFGLGDFAGSGLVLINLADEPEYCEKLMYARHRQTTPAHCHARKKEDIIARAGTLAVQVWQGKPDAPPGHFTVPINGVPRTVAHGETVMLRSGERITLVPGVYHAFWPETEDCVIGEVSTANDDLHDNFFIDPNIGRYTGIEEDEPPVVRLLNEKG